MFDTFLEFVTDFVRKYQWLKGYADFGWLGKFLTNVIFVIITVKYVGGSEGVGGVYKRIVDGWGCWFFALFSYLCGCKFLR